MAELVKNNKKYKVLTSNGFKDFAGVSLMGNKPGLRLEFEDGIWIECTYDHKIFINNNTKLEAKNINIGDTVLTTNGDKKLINITEKASENVYDLIEVADVNRFYANDVLVSNCEFIIYDETLIDALKLVGLKGREPLMRTGEVRWFHKPKKGRIYLVGLDPSLGTGGDFAAIQVFDGISMEQVAEWQHNKSPVKRQIKIMQDIIGYIAKETGYTETAHTETEIYWSVENNTLGEACLTVIEHTGEENFAGMMVNQPKTGSGQRRYRKGFTTTAKTKLSVCATLKNLVEANKMEVNSRRLVKELKNFVANGLKFEAKVGETDDLISATLLVLRISNHLAKYDDRIHDRLAQNAGDDDEFGFEEPLPMGII